MQMVERGLSEEQRMMRESCRAFVDDFVTPFIRRNWQREWLMDPGARLPAEILEQADRIGDADPARASCCQFVPDENEFDGERTNQRESGEVVQDCGERRHGGIVDEPFRAAAGARQPQGGRRLQRRRAPRRAVSQRGRRSSHSARAWA